MQNWLYDLSSIPIVDRIVELINILYTRNYNNFGAYFQWYLRQLRAVFSGSMGMGYLITELVIILFLILMVVSRWRLFRKAGEHGWKALIPLYNVYTLVKLTWSTLLFWTMLDISIISYLFPLIFTSTTWLSTACYIGLGAALFVLYIIWLDKISLAYGHGGGFAVGLFFLPVIFVPILGLGPSRYVGRWEPKKKATSMILTILLTMVLLAAVIVVSLMISSGSVSISL